MYVYEFNGKTELLEFFIIIYEPVSPLCHSISSARQFYPYLFETGFRYTLRLRGTDGMRISMLMNGMFTYFDIPVHHFLSETTGDSFQLFGNIDFFRFYMIYCIPLFWRNRLRIQGRNLEYRDIFQYRTKQTWTNQDCLKFFISVLSQPLSSKSFSLVHRFHDSDLSLTETLKFGKFPRSVS